MFPCYVFCFLLGNGCLQFFSSLPSPFWVYSFSLVSGLGLFFRNVSQKNGFSPFLGLFFAFGLGFLSIYYAASQNLSKALPPELEQTAVTVVGTISSLPILKEEGVKFEFTVHHTLPETAWKNPGKVILRLKSPPDSILETFKVGSEWQFTVKMKRPHGFSNPGSFDKEKYFFQNGWQAEGNILENPGPQYLSHNLLSHPLDRLREELRSFISSQLKDPRYRGMILTLIVGSREEISQAQWQVLRETGTVHLMAIAGLHVGFVMTLFYFLSRLLWKALCAFPSVSRIPLHKAALCGGFVFAGMYACLVGLPLPTQRALIMLGVWVFCQLFNRKLSSLNSLCLAMLLVLCLDPLATLGMGFWLSFGAVGLILYGVQGKKGSSGLARWTKIQWVLFVGLTPFMLCFFQETSFVSPLANLIAVPTLGFLILPLVLSGSCISCVNLKWGALILKGAETALHGLFSLLEGLKHLPYATWINAEASFYTLFLCLIGVMLLLAPRGVPGRLMGFVFLLPLFFSRALPLERGQARMTVLDVGQGLSVVVETRHHVLIYDTGPKLGFQFDAGERIVLPFLANQGIQKIDTVMISHGDNDHVGGMGAILDNLPVSNIITSEPKRIQKPVQKPEAEYCYAGQNWEWDEVRFEVLHPRSLQHKKRNDNSCVLRIKAGNQILLLTGDIESTAELQLIESNPQLEASILLVPHHGSHSSSTDPFLEAVKPHYAIISRGYLNSYGHPRQEVLDRYQQKRIKILDTVKDGAVTFLIGGRAGGGGGEEPVAIEPVSYRLANFRFWHIPK